MSTNVNQNFRSSWNRARRARLLPQSNANQSMSTNEVWNDFFALASLFVIVAIIAFLWVR